jgi:hypothetical protein
MAIALKFCVDKSADCKSFLITDRTLYYSIDNTGGWGYPNPVIGTATSASITIEKRNLDGSYTTSPLSPISVFSTLPSNSGGSVSVTAEQAGYGTDATFDDAIYRITYNVAGNSGGAYSATKAIYYTHTCAIDCCYQQKALEASTCNCVCDDANKELQNIAFYRRLLNAAICCGNLSLIQTYLDLLNKLCAQCAGCSSGCSTC